MYGIQNIEVLYSGGIDSEFVLASCKKLNKNVTAITMEIVNKGVTVNDYELALSKKFCRANNINQKIITLDTKFYDNGDYIKFLTPYYIRKANIASQFWLITQCEHFLIFGGNHFWVQLHNINNTKLSPMSYGSCFHDKFMIDNNIKGIGNMLNYGYSGLIDLIKTHVKIYNAGLSLGQFKQLLYEKLLGDRLELREPRHGWEGYEGSNLHLNYKNFEIITWDDNIKNIINSKTNTNIQR